MSKGRRTATRHSHLGTIHERAGCNLSVHGLEKRSHKDAGCKYVTHGPNPLSKLITLVSVQKRKNQNKRRQQRLENRTRFHKTKSKLSTMTVRRSGRNRRAPKRFLQEGAGEINNHMRNIEQARLIHQRRYGNPWMTNGYAARL